ncbi:MAG: hypothetical protein II305_01950 [Clostridia bacterium]|nr:hypothetical protein [Clostridia bacterium]
MPYDKRYTIPAHERQEQDTAYLDAINNSDTKTAQKTVDKLNRDLKKTQSLLYNYY